MREVHSDKKKVIAALAASHHGKLAEYVPVALQAAVDDPDFFAHLIAWNHLKGAIRDAKIALPILALLALKTRPDNMGGDAWPPLVDNALAHLADLRPREFVKAIMFGWDQKAPTRMLKRLTIRYLRDMEADRFEWEATALRHRQSLRWLYAQAQIPVKSSESAVFGQFRKGKDRGIRPHRFTVLSTLANLSPVEIGGMMDKYKLPFLNVRGALGAKAKEPDVVLALMKRMSPTELVTNMKWLKRVGVQTVPALRSQLEASLGEAAKPQKRRAKISATLKTTRAAEALADDEALSGKLRVLQEKQIEVAKVEKGIDGDWLVLADKSGSMEEAMETARMIAGVLAKMVRGKVHLVFFSTEPRYFDVTGKTYEEIKALTATMTAQGGTSIGIGLAYLYDRKIAVDGIAIVSDGCENAHLMGRSSLFGGAPPFASVYPNYVKLIDLEPTVYWYRTKTSFPAAVLQKYPLFDVQNQAKSEIDEFERSCRAAKIDVQLFDLTKGVDYYSVPNLVGTMKIGRFQLLDDILAMPLRSLDEVLDKAKGERVLPEVQPVRGVNVRV